MSESKDESQSLESFARRFLACRKAKGFTQRKLAELLGLGAHTQVSRYETVDSQPSVAMLQKIAEALEVDLHWLVCGTKSPMAAAIEKTLLAYARAHVNEVSVKLQALEDERVDLVAAGSPGGDENDRLEAIQSGIEKLQNYLRNALNEIHAAAGQSNREGALFSR